MRKLILGLIGLLLAAPQSPAKTLTYNRLDIVNLRDQGLPADERSTNALLAHGNVVYGATSGDRCHIFRFTPASGRVEVLATLPGPNTILKAFAHDGSGVLYAGTMLTRRQLYLEGRRRGGSFEELDANLSTIDDSWGTGHLYRLSGLETASPRLEDLGVPVPGQGIQALAGDAKRGLLYGLTYPSGRFFVFDPRTRQTETITFGRTRAHVSNHMVAFVEVVKDLADYLPGEVEFGGKLPARAMHVASDGALYTSGWDGKIVRYDPDVPAPEDRFTVVGDIPCVPGRQYWNRVDEIVEHDGRLLMGSSDGYLFRFDPATGTVDNWGKPVRAIETMGLAVSPLDGNLYGITGGDLEGMSRFWCRDAATGSFEVDYPALKGFRRRAMGDLVALADGTLVMAETDRVADLWVLRPGEPAAWTKSGVIRPFTSPNKPQPERERFGGHARKLEAEVYPIPSEMHGGTGYTAIEFDRQGKLYVGTAFYGRSAALVRLDLKSGVWERLFRSDELTHQFARGVGAPGKIHTKLRLGSDGRIYGGMKQGWEFAFDTRPDIGEAPEGQRGGYLTSHFFSYDPATGQSRDLGPGYPQNGLMGFCADVARGFLYTTTDPAIRFLAHDLKTGRTFDAGAVSGNAPARYMALDEETGRVYHPGEATTDGRFFMTVWDPKAFRLRDYEIAVEGDLKYRHSYTIACGPRGSGKLYGSNWAPDAWEMDLEPHADGKLHVRRICPVSVDGESVKGSMNCLAVGPDGRVYWGTEYEEEGPAAVFCWDPRTRTRTYLGTLALGGEWLKNIVMQGLAIDRDGNLALHVLYVKLTESQKKLAHWQPGTTYRDIEERPHYLGAPGHLPGTYYAVIVVRGAAAPR